MGVPLTLYVYFSVLVVTPNAWNEIYCRPGWTQIGGSCLLLVKLERTWEQSLLFCSALKSSLVYVETEEEMVYLKQTALKFRRHIMMGGADVLQEGNWVWIESGQSARGQGVQNWGPGQPNSAYATDDILVTSFNDGKWHDWGTSNTAWFVCKTKIG